MEGNSQGIIKDKSGDQDKKNDQILNKASGLSPIKVAGYQI